MDQAELLVTALEIAADQGATYAEARLVRLDQEVLELLNGEVETAFNSHSAGLGVRVLVDGGWGFAAKAETDPRPLIEVVRQAVTLAGASASLRREPVILAPATPIVAEHRDLGHRDPFAVPIAERLALLRDTHAAMTEVNNIVRTQAQMDLRREYVEVMTPEGTRTRDRRARRLRAPIMRAKTLFLSRQPHGIGTVEESRMKGSPSVGRTGPGSVSPRVREAPHPIPRCTSRVAMKGRDAILNSLEAGLCSPRAGQTDIVLTSQHLALTRFPESRIHPNVDEPERSRPRDWSQPDG